MYYLARFLYSFYVTKQDACTFVSSIAVLLASHRLLQHIIYMSVFDRDDRIIAEHRLMPAIRSTLYTIFQLAIVMFTVTASLDQASEASSIVSSNDQICIFFKTFVQLSFVKYMHWHAYVNRCRINGQIMPHVGVIVHLITAAVILHDTNYIGINHQWPVVAYLASAVIYRYVAY